jgi:hypothetical protein
MRPTGHRLPTPVLKHKAQCAVGEAVVVCLKTGTGVSICFAAVTPGVSLFASLHGNKHETSSGPKHT